MPLSIKAQETLQELAKQSPDYSLFGIFLNPQTGEMGTYSSSGFAPGQILGFLQQAVQQMLDAAMSGELEIVGGNDAKSSWETPESELRRVH